MPRLSGQAALRADWYNRSCSRPKAPCRLSPGNCCAHARPSRSADRSISPNKNVLPPMASHRNKLRPKLPHHHYRTDRVPCLRDIRRRRWILGPRSLPQWACTRDSNEVAHNTADDTPKVQSVLRSRIVGCAHVRVQKRISLHISDTSKAPRGAWQSRR
jgi:hypothetical protein